MVLSLSLGPFLKEREIQIRKKNSIVRLIILKFPLDVTCTATGDRIDVALAKRRSYNIGFSSFGSRLSRRQVLGK